MKNTLTIIIILIFSAFSRAQRGESWINSVKNDAKVLFNNVSKIELIELKPYCSIKKYPSRFFGIPRKYESCYESSIIREESQLDTTHIGKRIELKSTLYDSLFNILYDSELSTSSAACYNPRHGIIFYDINSSVIGYLEICFECNRIYSFPNTPNLGPPIRERFNELKRIFTE
ncbi:MAG: hypothetical protein MK105_13780 [Crocinitomicaceae bacterium]|nr:hypothetical protein [Crocinitomicaceae bacterium]